MRVQSFQGIQPPHIQPPHIQPAPMYVICPTGSSISLFRSFRWFPANTTTPDTKTALSHSTLLTVVASTLRPQEQPHIKFTLDLFFCKSQFEYLYCGRKPTTKQIFDFLTNTNIGQTIDHKQNHTQLIHHTPFFFLYRQETYDRANTV